jgi:hypothetical protein
MLEERSKSARGAARSMVDQVNWFANLVRELVLTGSVLLFALKCYKENGRIMFFRKMLAFTEWKVKRSKV